MRDFSITRNKGEMYNAQVTDSYGNKYQNYFEHAYEANDWIYYIWSKEEWFNSANSQELLANAIVISMVILIVFIIIIENIK